MQVRSVTGVHTLALPTFPFNTSPLSTVRFAPLTLLPTSSTPVTATPLSVPPLTMKRPAPAVVRSEERRVGTEYSPGRRAEQHGKHALAVYHERPRFNARH